MALQYATLALHKKTPCAAMSSTTRALVTFWRLLSECIHQWCNQRGHPSLLLRSFFCVHRYIPHVWSHFGLLSFVVWEKIWDGIRQPLASSRENAISEYEKHRHLGMKKMFHHLVMHWLLIAHIFQFFPPFGKVEQSYHIESSLQSQIMLWNWQVESLTPKAQEGCASTNLEDAELVSMRPRYI